MASYLRDEYSGIKAVIFDLDDTLFPERDYVISGFRRVALYLEAEYGCERDEIFGLLKADYENGLRGNNFDVLLEKIGLESEADLVTALVKEYRSHKPQISLPDISAELLTYLVNKSYSLGLLTDGYLECQRLKVESLGLEKFMDAVVYTDWWGRAFWKPHTKGYFEVIRKLGVDEIRCCYVADNPEKDFKGAKVCGMRTLQVLQWVSKDAALFPKECRPEAVVDSLADLMQIF